eukprot:9483255-Pyramimonas_sp.AAC.1
MGGSYDSRGCWLGGHRPVVPDRSSRHEGLDHQDNEAHGRTDPPAGHRRVRRPGARKVRGEADGHPR